MNVFSKSLGESDHRDQRRKNVRFQEEYTFMKLCFCPIIIVMVGFLFKSANWIVRPLFFLGALAFFASKAAPQECDGWNAIYKSPVTEGHYSTITLLRNYACTSCEAIAVLQGFSETGLNWIHQGLHYCGNGASGCHFGTDPHGPWLYINFVSAQPDSSDKKTILVIGGLFSTFWYGNPILHDPAKREIDKRSTDLNVSASVSDVFYLAECRPPLRVEVRDTFSNDIIEVDAIYYGAWGVETHKVYVGCKETSPQVRIGEDTFVLQKGMANPENAPTDAPLGEIWQAACRR